jgi:tRNA-2-methylthio-N6-dimethylallyladenosine synthase
MTKQSVYMETYGCQMNTYDSELVKHILIAANYSMTDHIQTADIALLNTCSVRENANNKVLNRIHDLKKINPTLCIGLLGCMATNFKTDLLENNRLKIDLIAGPDSYGSLPFLLRDAFDASTAAKPYDVTLSEFETYENVAPVRTDKVNGWIAIMRGCNNFCTFCVVPYTRGRERSRSLDSVLSEVKLMVDNGYKQVTLLGQNVNSYRYGNHSFTDLLDAVSSKTGISRIRFTSPHPKDFPLDLLTLINERDNICKQIHVPLQAGNNRVLKKMNRTYTKESYLDLIHTMKTAIPNVALSTDIIVGFPTETDLEFQDTLAVCNDVEFDHAFIFKYSQRPNTRAALKFPDDISPEQKTKRITQLIDQQKRHSLNRNSRWIHAVQDILVERIDGDTIIGRNDANVLVYSASTGKIGDMVKVKITAATPHGLKATHP